MSNGRPRCRSQDRAFLASANGTVFVPVTSSITSPLLEEMAVDSVVVVMIAPSSSSLASPPIISDGNPEGCKIRTHQFLLQHEHFVHIVLVVDPSFMQHLTMAMDSSAKFRTFPHANLIKSHVHPFLTDNGAYTIVGRCLGTAIKEYVCGSVADNMKSYNFDFR